MAETASRPNFFSRIGQGAANRITPGSIYDSRGNYLNNGGRAAVATGIKFLANTFVPGGGMIADRVLRGWVDRGANYGIGQPVREQIEIPGAPASAQNAITAPSPLSVNNLGLGAQRPGGSWYGYTGGAGSMGSFGNTQFGNGMASIGQWNPQSAWGQQVAAPTGSNLGLGNNVGGFIGGGSGGSGGSSGQTSGGGMPGIVGGRFAGGNAVDYKRGFITTKKA